MVSQVNIWKICRLWSITFCLSSEQYQTIVCMKVRGTRVKSNHKYADSPFPKDSFWIYSDCFPTQTPLTHPASCVGRQQVASS